MSGLYSTGPETCCRLQALGNALVALQPCVLAGVRFSTITAKWHKIIVGSNTALAWTWKSCISSHAHLLFFSVVGTQTSALPVALSMF